MPDEVGAGALLKAASLAKSFRDVEAVRDATLAVKAGEVVGLLGPNGAGKTTTLRMLAGVLTPTSGAAFVAGHDVVADPVAARRALGFLTGATALYARLTPREVLVYFGRLHGLANDVVAERVARLIEALEMKHFADRACGGLSTGQRQRANIARALVHDPAVLIFDEPTSGLDLAAAHFILDFVRRARDEGRAVLFSTHTMGDAEALCDTIAVMSQGTIVASGALAEILAVSGGMTLAEAFLRLVKTGEDERPSGRKGAKGDARA